MDISVTFHGAIANELALAQKIVELKNKIDHEKAHFKKNMVKLSVADVQISRRCCMISRQNFTRSVKKQKVQESA